MSDTALSVQVVSANRLLTAPEFENLADVPPKLEWFANISNQSTRRAYQNALQDFMRFTGIKLSTPDHFWLFRTSCDAEREGGMIERP